MTRLLGTVLAAALSFTSQRVVAQQARADDCIQANKASLLSQGCTVLDEFMRTFNSKDGPAWAATLNYPHVRLAGNEVQVWNTPAEYAQSNDVRELGKTGWSHSQWDWRQLVQSSNDKLHFLVQFTRYDAGGKPIGSYESLYILTLKDGHWGVQARSSYAGIVLKSSAF